MASYRNRITATPVAISEYQKETNMENIEIEIPMQLLDAATYCAAVRDVRFYLCGIAINKGHIVSTDGHRAFACQIEGLNEEIEFIIPTDAIKHFLKKLPSKLRKANCKVIFDPRAQKGEIIFEKRDGQHIEYARELFVAIDGKFPDWKRIFPRTVDSEYKGIYPQFNWAYMHDFQKVQKALGGKGMLALLHPKSANEAALVTFDNTDFDHAKGVIMPLRA